VVRRVSETYRRVPIRWRLAGGSAALTAVILLGFAVIVGVLTERQVKSDFNRQVREAADDLASRLKVIRFGRDGRVVDTGDVNLRDYAKSDNAFVSIGTESNDLVGGSSLRTPYLPPPSFGQTLEYEGYRIETRPIYARLPSGQGVQVYLRYGRPLSDLGATVRQVRLVLALGVLGGTLLALLAGLATARRAMAPIAELTEAARRIERSRDPSARLPAPAARDEVAELAATLDGMLAALDGARSETEATLSRQREFVADASHELRTPLTSVLANLELLEEILEGEAREAATSALRSSRRMRRLVADLLLLARADAGRIARHEPIDLSLVVAEAAGELEPVTGDHALRVDAAEHAVVDGARDELHRLVLNLLENALRHTDPATAVEATVTVDDGQVVLAVEDDGPGIAPELRDKVFERFFRASSDRGGSSGLGLAIVRAVAASHDGTVTLEPPLDGRGARFVVRIPAAKPALAEAQPPALA
jgi:signal transduction histidine kinase